MKKINISLLSLVVMAGLSFSTTAQTHTKKAKLTETELNRWSHLDLAKDTIPGMSVDKAYAELLKGKKGVPVIDVVFGVSYPTVLPPKKFLLNPVLPVAERSGTL